MAMGRAFAGRLAALVLILLGAVPAPAAAARDSLTIGITQFPSTLHPAIDSMMAKTYVLAMTRRPLTVYDADWTVVCLLCVELPTIENGGATPLTTPDGKPGIAVTYRIHPDAKWGDGTPVSADDVVFSWEVGRHPKSGVGNIELYRSLYKIDVVDAKTVTLHFDKRTFEYNSLSGLDILPAHLERAAFANPQEYRHRTLYDTDSTNPGLYYGPYRITGVTAGSHLVLEPNPSWWGEPPALKRIVVRAIENTAALEANLLSGGIDMIAGELGLSIEQAVAFERRHGRRFQVIYKPGLVYEHIDLNLDNPMLKDGRVRQALIHAIDRDAISQRLFDGKQPVAHSGVNPLDWVHADDTPRYAYNPKRAAALLDAAGWSAMRGGVRHNAAGEKLSLELMTTAGNRTRELVQQVLQSQWAEAGIAVRIRNQPPRVFFGETVTRRRFGAMAMFAWISAPESVPRTTLHSTHIPTEANNWAGQNYTGYVSDAMDALIEKIEIELDRDTRAGLWRDLQHRYATDLPAIPLYFRANSYILPRWLRGVTPTGHQFPTTFWVEHWRAAE
jgi:peptide/nickel transport system substrate-binding protein